MLKIHVLFTISTFYPFGRSIFQLLDAKKGQAAVSFLLCFSAEVIEGSKCKGMLEL